uniref:glucan 1,4-alpha-glucosidase n=1 Tax=Oxyrrhis marina TaxID=2969 RepID=A0A7S4LNP1_OXYMA
MKLLLSAFLAASADQCDVAEEQRSDCGFVGVTQDQCESKGCCWKEAGQGSSVPWCYYKGGSPGPSPGPSPAPSSCPLKYESKGAPFSEAEMSKISGYYDANLDISGSGAVVAAPDHDTGPGGDYYFHWERDGGLSMHALLATASSVSAVDEKFQHYLTWVKKVQGQQDPHGIDVRLEPKYNIPDGTIFDGGWCRPQTDGPGLRARALADYAMAKVAAGDKSQTSAIYDVVKHDLEWVVSNWQQNGCDLWEEIQSNDFFWGRYTMRAGLNAGAVLADEAGDSATASTYRSVMKDIEATLGNHYTGSFVFESQNRQKDTAVIEAFNDGDFDGNTMFAPLSKEVLGTVVTLNDLFCSTYEINQKDTAAGVPGILYGRYEGDSYDGGNPWVLLTATLAQLIYRQAAAATTGTVDKDTYALLQQAYSIDAGLTGAALGKALMGAGDGVLMRIRKHVEADDFHMKEQLSRTDGSQTSAKDLTWGYANILKAMKARKDASAAVGLASSVIV